jgi:restriction system protein
MATKSDLPSFEEYFVPTVAALKARGGSATIEELEEEVAARMNLPDEVRAVPHGDGPQTQFQYELAWVRTYLKKIDAAENSERGVWRLTPIGLTMSDGEIGAIPRKVRAAEQERRRQEAKEKAAKKEQHDFDSNVEVGEAAELTWKEKLLDLLLALPAAGFERLCQRILRESGFIKVEVTGRSGDGGIDGIGILRVQLVSFQVLFQSKKWKGTVGASVVRDFRGAMIGRADKGLIITTGTFSADARREATRDGAPAIDLVDGDYLCDLLKQLRIGVSVQQIEHVAIDEKSFAEI